MRQGRSVFLLLFAALSDLKHRGDAFRRIPQVRLGLWLTLVQSVGPFWIRAYWPRSCRVLTPAIGMPSRRMIRFQIGRVLNFRKGGCELRIVLRLDRSEERSVGKVGRWGW